MRTSKKTNVALVSTPVWTLSTPPLNIAYLKSYLVSKGFDTICYDLNIELYHMIAQKARRYWDCENYHYWHNPQFYDKHIRADIIEPYIDWCAKKAMETKPAVVGISVLSPLFIADLTKAIKTLDPEVTIILGGQMCHSSMAKYKLLKIPEVDILVEGEGEQALLEICEAIEAGVPPENIDGCVIKTDDGYIKEKPMKRIDDLSEIPYPDFSDFDINLYYDDMEMTRAAESLPILFARGCCNRCDFCLQRQIWLNRFKSRKAQEVFDEMMHDYKTYGVKKFIFADLLINGNVKELEHLCDLIIAKGPKKMEWWGSAVVRKNMTQEQFYKLKAAGCHMLTIGLESGADPVLKAMNKPYTGEDAKEFIKKAHKAGIVVPANIIVGHPAETREDFENTLSFLAEIRPFMPREPWPTMCAIIPGTDLYEKCMHDPTFAYRSKENPNHTIWDTDTNTLEDRRRRIDEFREYCEKEYAEFKMLRSDHE